MFDQSDIIWRYLTGMDPTAKKEFRLAGQVVDYWQQRWAAELRPEEMALADGVRSIQQQIQTVADGVFRRFDSGQRQAAFAMAQRELKGRLLPALTQMNREIYRRARESSVRGAYTRLEEILASQERVLLVIVVLSLAGGLLGSWLISRSLARPINELTGAMAVVGAGQLDHPITSRSRDEIGALAGAFGRMTDNLRQSRAALVQSEKLASIGEMAAAVAHGLRNPLAAGAAASRGPILPRASRCYRRGSGPAGPPDQPLAELLPAGALPSTPGERCPSGRRPTAGFFAAAAGTRDRAPPRPPRHTS